jgi:S1-C subfamily serine protease
VLEPFDLVMLKIDAVDLPSIRWGLKDPSVGQWVAVPGLGEDPLAIGVISTPRRPIPPRRGLLGVTIGKTPKGVVIILVIPKGPADKAGLKRNDIITHVNGKPVKSYEAFTTTMKRFKPGAKVKLTVKRGDKSLGKTVTLSTIVNAATKKRDMLNAMGVGMSKRHDGFPVVIQHDCGLRPVDCGGPLVTLDGRAVGVNIARGGRTETYCVPANALISLMYELMSGRARPEDADEQKKTGEAPESPGEKPGGPSAKPKSDVKPTPKRAPKKEAKPEPKKMKPKAEAKAAPKTKSTPKPAKKKLEPTPDPKAGAKPEPKAKKPAPKKAEAAKEAGKQKKAEKPQAKKPSDAKKLEVKPEAKKQEAKQPEKKAESKAPTKKQEPKQPKKVDGKKPAPKDEKDAKKAAGFVPDRAMQPTSVSEPLKI